MTTQRRSPDDRRVGAHIALSRKEQADLAALAVRLGCSRSEAVRRGLELLEASL